MDGFIVILSVVMFVFCVLQIVLFFKIWGMTNNVKYILEVLNCKDNRDVKLPKTARVKWLENEFEIVGMKNGKVLCNVKKGYEKELVLFNLTDLIIDNE